MQKLTCQLFSIMSMILQSVLCEGGEIRKNSRVEKKKGGGTFSITRNGRAKIFIFQK